jgi:hypothetical protein
VIMSSMAVNPPPVRGLCESSLLFCMPIVCGPKRICGPSGVTTGRPSSNRGATKVL